MRIKQAVIAAVLLAYAGACTKWVPNTTPLPTEIEKGPTRLRLYTTGGQVLPVTGAWLRNDSLIGWSEGRRVSLATADITRIERQIADGNKTGVLVVGVAILVGGAIGGAIALENMAAGSSCCPSMSRRPSRP